MREKLKSFLRSLGFWSVFERLRFLHRFGWPVVELVEDCSADSMKAALGRLDNRSYRADLGTALSEEFRADFDPLMLQNRFENYLRILVK